MSAPMRLPRHQREADMLTAATEVFARGGFAGVSMDVIAGECGITKPMLYRYFGSKQGLYLACLQRSGAELIGAITAAAAQAPDREERIRRGFLAFLTFVDARRVGWNMLFHDAATIPPPVAASVSELRGQLADLLAAVLIQPDAALCDAQAHALISAAQALANWHLDHPERAPNDLATLFSSLCGTRPGAGLSL